MEDGDGTLHMPILVNVLSVNLIKDMFSNSVVMYDL